MQRCSGCRLLIRLLNRSWRYRCLLIELASLKDLSLCRSLTKWWRCLLVIESKWLSIFSLLLLFQLSIAIRIEGTVFSRDHLTATIVLFGRWVVHRRRLRSQLCFTWLLLQGVLSNSFASTSGCKTLLRLSFARWLLLRVRVNLLLRLIVTQQICRSGDFRTRLDWAFQLLLLQKTLILNIFRSYLFGRAYRHIVLSLAACMLLVVAVELISNVCCAWNPIGGSHCMRSHGCCWLSTFLIASTPVVVVVWSTPVTISASVISNWVFSAVPSAIDRVLRRSTCGFNLVYVFL